MLQQGDENGWQGLYSGQADSAIMEINSETIDALAAESAEEYIEMKEAYAREFSKPRPERPARVARAEKSERPQRREWSERQQKPDRSAVPATRGFALHYSAPPVIPTRSANRPAKQSSLSEELRDISSNRERPDHPFERKEKEPWMIQKAALKEKFQEGWAPRKKLSPDALAGIRAIHAQFPEQYTTSILAEKFEVSPEVIRRILKSKWRPTAEEEIDRQESWFKRGEKVWGRYAELGLKPPAKWRKAGVGKREDGQAPLWSQKSSKTSSPRALTNATSIDRTEIPFTTGRVTKRSNEGRTEWSLSERIL